MNQSSLLEYFRYSCRPPSTHHANLSFLDLPFHVRRRVNILAGLVRVCPIDLNLEGCERPTTLAALPLDYSPSNWMPGTSDAIRVSDAAAAARGCRYRQKRFFHEGSIFDHLGSHNSEETGFCFNCVCGRLPYELFHTCRAISMETRRIIYSENRFVVSQSGYRSFYPLLNLTP